MVGTFSALICMFSALNVAIADMLTRMGEVCWSRSDESKLNSARNKASRSLNHHYWHKCWVSRAGPVRHQRASVAHSAAELRDLREVRVPKSLRRGWLGRGALGLGGDVETRQLGGQHSHVVMRIAASTIVLSLRELYMKYSDDLESTT
jgi:hypothetical protein